jgi:hypothetical protein
MFERYDDLPTVRITLSLRVHGLDNFVSAGSRL